MSRPIQPSAIPSAGHDLVLRRRCENAVATTTSTGRTSSMPLCSRVGDQPLAGLDLVGLQQRVADPVALGGQERVAHAAADEQSVDALEQVGDHAELVGDLRAAQDDDVRAVRVGEHLLEDLRLLQDEPAGGVRQQLGDVGHRGLLAVHDPEAVGDVDVGQCGQLVGERAALGGVLAGLARVEPDVLQQRHLAVGHRRHGGLGPGAGRGIGQHDVLAEQLAEPRGHRAPARARASGSPLGRPRCAATITFAPDRSGGQGGKAGPDAAVVGDDAVHPGRPSAGR